MENIKDRLSRAEVEHKQGWREEIKNIPFIRFPPNWEVQVIPPFGDAVARFRVRLPSGTVKSVYLDVRDSLGCYGAPYWEVYPYQDDVGRCDRSDVEELLSMITQEDSPEGEK